MNELGRNILIKLAIYFEGDWDQIYKSLVNKEDLFEQISNISIDDKCITILDENYPEYLKHGCKPPFVLFYEGDLSLLNDYSNNLGIIGSREPSGYGIEITRKIIKELKENDIIVSGLARGIDGIAHQEAILTNHKTIAVLGSGIDYCYPSENFKLFKEIKKNHLLLSEYPRKTRPKQEYFLARNRIIASLCKAVLVTEAHVKSGTMSTVSFALDKGKDILCVPTFATEDSGPNLLIKEGACVVLGGSDVDEYLG